MQGYRLIRAPLIYIPRVPHTHPYQQAPRRTMEYDPNMTLEDALNGGFTTEEAKQPMNDQQIRSDLENSRVPRNTGYGPDTRIGWNESNLVSDTQTRNSE